MKTFIEKKLRDIAIQACGEMLDAFYDSRFDPGIDWNKKFINIYDKMVENYENEALNVIKKYL